MIERGTVSASYARDVDVRGILTVGGLVGQVWGGTLIETYATGRAQASQDVGGLIGMLNHRSVVIDGLLRSYPRLGESLLSFASVDVAANTSGAGGLIGTRMAGSYIATYATVTMSVGAQRSWLAAGGFVGECFQPALVYAVSKANYATGEVNQGVRNVSSWVGGFTGYCAEARRSRDINMVLSYWDTQTTGQAESVCEYRYNTPSHNMLVGKTTAQLQTPTNENAYDAGSIYEHWQ